jgi:Glutaredoxin
MLGGPSRCRTLIPLDSEGNLRVTRSPSAARLVFACIAMVVALLWTSAAAARAPDVELFTREGCPRCDDAKAFVRDVATKHPEIVVVVVDLGRDPAARRRLSEIAKERHASAASVPSMLVRDTLVVGWSAGSTPARVEALLSGTSSGSSEPGETCSADDATPCEPSAAPRSEIVLPLFGRIDLNVLGLPMFTLAVGLVDGFNPCAMWVLLLLLALLVNLKSRLKMGLVAGVFVVVSGLAYYAFMAAWLNAFLFVGISRTVAVVTLGRRKLQERAGRWLKLVSGSVIVLVGVLLVVRPQWLSWR